MDKVAQFAPTGKGVHYERRRPEETVLYQLVQEHVETFLAQVEAETGAGLPDFIKEEFDAFLQCGILGHELAIIAWRFTSTEAREKLHRLYPSHSK